METTLTFCDVVDENNQTNNEANKKNKQKKILQNNELRIIWKNTAINHAHRIEKKVKKGHIRWYHCRQGHGTELKRNPLFTS